MACAAGKYELSKADIEFSQYMREEGYHIIPIKAKHQLVCVIYLCFCQATDVNGVLDILSDQPTLDETKKGCGHHSCMHVAVTPVQRLSKGDCF